MERASGEGPGEKCNRVDSGAPISTTSVCIWSSVNGRAYETYPEVVNRLGADGDAVGDGVGALLCPSLDDE